jgi:DNA-directed RNA polymerase specialized sigma24 family protein
MTPDNDRKRVLASVDEFVDACGQFRKTLSSVAAANRRVRSLVEEGRPVREVLSAIPTSAIRKTMTQQIEDLEASRHNVRRAVFALGLKEGLSIGELGRLMGFSRQLASTYAKEARGET